MSEDSFRTVSVERATVGRYVARNVRGGTLDVGTGEDNSFTPVELLLVAIGACTAIDVDLVVSRRAEPDTFLVNISGDKVRDEGGNRMEHLAVEFRVAFPEGPEGDAARAALPRSVRMSHDRLCTVSRTVELGTPVTTTMAP
jgi:putative redox protein